MFEINESLDTLYIMKQFFYQALKLAGAERDLAFELADNLLNNTSCRIFKDAEAYAQQRYKDGYKDGCNAKMTELAKGADRDLMIDLFDAIADEICRGKAEGEVLYKEKEKTDDK